MESILEEMSNGSSIDDEEADKNIVERTSSEIKDAQLCSEQVMKHQALLVQLVSNDYSKLCRSAISKGGLLSDNLRRKIWPKLAEVDIYSTSPKPSTQVIEEHPYYSQVVLDVNRSLKRFPPSIAEKQRLSMQDQLVALIMRVLIKHPELHYYQGYHDICVTFLLVLGEEIAFNVVEKLSTTKLRLFMDKTMQRTSEHLQHIYPLIGKRNNELRAFLERSEVGVMFCLSWIITWYGHVLVDYETVVRMFDFFLASKSWMPLYLAAAIVLHKQQDIMKLECDMACVHSYLSRITDDLPFEKLIFEAQVLFKDFPPNDLQDALKHERIANTTENRSLSRTVLSVIGNVVSYIIPSSFSSTAVSLFVIFAALVMYRVYNRERSIDRP